MPRRQRVAQLVLELAAARVGLPAHDDLGDHEAGDGEDEREEDADAEGAAEHEQEHRPMPAWMATNSAARIGRSALLEQPGHAA